MSINSVNTINKVNTPIKKNTTEVNQGATTPPKEIKDGKKKLLLAATAVATIAIAGIAIAKGRSKAAQAAAEEVTEKGANKVAKAAEEVTEKASEVSEEIQNAAKLRTEAQAKFKKDAKQAQEKYKNLYEGNLSNKSAKESAEVFNQNFKAQEIQNAAELKTEAQAKFKEDAKQAQEKYKNLYEGNLSNKSAKESVEVFNTYEAYQKRLQTAKDGKIDFNQRIKEADGKYWGVDHTKLKTSQKRIQQLNTFLSPEQQAALDDSFVSRTLQSNFTLPAYDVKNLEFVADNFSAEDLITLQQNTYSPQLLENFISGYYNTQEDATEIISYLKKVANK